MSFTIKCDKCGNEVKFHNGDSRLGDKIQIIPYITGRAFMEGWTVEGVDLYCENPNCNNEVFIK